MNSFRPIFNCIQNHGKIFNVQNDNLYCFLLRYTHSGFDCILVFSYVLHSTPAFWESGLYDFTLNIHPVKFNTYFILCSDAVFVCVCVCVCVLCFPHRAEFGGGERVRAGDAREDQ